MVEAYLQKKKYGTNYDKKQLRIFKLKQNGNYIDR